MKKTILWVCVILGMIACSSGEKRTGEQIYQSSQKHFMGNLQRDFDLTLGNPTAPIQFVVFSDPYCIFCHQFEETLFSLMDNAKYKDKIFIVWKVYPLESIHPRATEAALSILKLNQQGKAWSMIRKLSEKQIVKYETFAQVAKEFGVVCEDITQEQLDSRKLSRDQNDRCVVNTLNDGSIRNFDQEKKWLKINIQDAQAVPVEGTPTWILNGKVFSGAMPAEKISAMLDYLIDKDKKS